VFRHHAQTLLNSTPRILVRDRCAVAQGAEAWPRRWTRPLKPQAVPAMTFFRPNEFSKRDDAIGPVGCSTFKVEIKRARHDRKKGRLNW
jgi:hypothetical protein